MPSHELQQSLAIGLPEGYTLQGRIGGGTYGAVYETTYLQGEHTETRAVKVLTDFEDPFSRRSFIEEGEHLAELSAHPNIVTVYDQGDFVHPQAGGIRIPYIAMERAVCSLANVKQGKEASAAKVTNWILGAIDGMAYVHNDAGNPDQPSRLHLDLKQGNLLLGKDGKVKVTDFGIARFNETGEPNPQQTRLIRIRGTAPYMDTTLFKGEPGRTSDIYALGIVAYELLSGERPITNDSGLDWNWMTAHATQVVQPMSTAGHAANNARLIEHLDDPIRKALEKDPSNRHRSMTEFGESIRDAIAAARGEKRRDTRYVISGKLPKLDTDEAEASKPHTKQYPAGPEKAEQTETPKVPSDPIRPRQRRGEDYHSVRRSVTIQRGGKTLHITSESHREGISRRSLLLGLCAAGGALGVGLIYRKELLDFFSTPGTEKTASPEQKGADYAGKKVVSALLAGQADNKKQAGAVLRDLARLSPNWAKDKLYESGGRWDFVHQFYRHLYLENPDAAYDVLEQFKLQNDDWDSVALLASFAGGYASIESSAVQQEKDRLQAHEKYNLKDTIGAQVSNMLKVLESLRGTDTTNWRQLLTCAMDPDNKAGKNAKSLAKTIDAFVAAGDYSSAGILGVVLAAKKPDIAARALEKTVTYALSQNTADAYGFVRILADGMAPYDDARASVIAQMKRINGKTKSDAARDATNHMAVSVGPFDHKAVIDYVNANMDYPDAQLTLLVVGKQEAKTLSSLRSKVAPENRIWYDLAIDPTNHDMVNTAIDALKANPQMLRRSGAIIGAALVNGRRFIDTP